MSSNLSNNRNAHPSYRPLSSYDISPNELQRLTKNGYYTVGNILKSKDESLKKLINFDKSDNCISVKTKRITTLVYSLDTLTDGGFSTMEIYGSFGSGKTQLCMQLCVSVQLPEFLGGLSSPALYIDTEGSLMETRMRQIAEGTLTQCLGNKLLNDNDKTLLSKYTIDDILSNIHVNRVNDFFQLKAVLYNLDNFIETHSVKLIIIDSMSFLLRSLKNRISHWCEIIQLLYNITQNFNLNVIVTNHVNASNESFFPNLLPIRLKCDKICQKYKATLDHHPYLTKTSVFYTIRDIGVRDDDKDFEPIVQKPFDCESIVKIS